MELRRDLLAQEIYIGYAIDLRFDPSILIPPTTGKRRSMTGHFRVTGAAYSLIAFSFSNAWKKIIPVDKINFFFDIRIARIL